MPLVKISVEAWAKRLRSGLAQVSDTIVLGALTLSLLGCSDVILSTTAAAPLYPCSLPASLPVGGLHLTSNAYHAYGDSITYGFLLPTNLDAYPYLMAHNLGMIIKNNAVNGALACDLSPNQIFPNNEDPTLASNMLYTVMIGTNDVARNIPGYTAVFDQCHQGAISWLAVPAESKVRANEMGVTTSGGGSLDTTVNWNAWVTSKQNASISFPITVENVRPLYIWARIIDGDTGTFNYSVDDTVIGTATTATTPVIYTSQGDNNSLALIRVPTVSPGTHTVTLTQTSLTGTMQIVAVGVPPASSTDLPNVLVGDVPYAVNTASTGCAGTATPALEYIAEIQKTVMILSADGLNVRYVPTREYMFGTPAEMEDVVHPNPLGHTELSKAFEAGLQ
jgi:lysophospholipase L1-like esterase